MSLGGNISETGGARSLTLNSAASSVFNGTNTYTGGTSVAAGSLAFLKTASMPSTGAVSFTTGATLGIGIGGDGWTSTGTGAGTLAGVFQGTNVGVGPGSSTFTYGASVGLNLIVTGNHSFGVLENLSSGASAYTQYGLGTLTMTGDNTYTGATTLQGGGGLILDYGSSDTSKFASAAALTLGGGANQTIGLYGGGTLTLKGGTFTEVVSATSLNTGHTTIARDGGTAKLRLNAITRAAGGTISFADAIIADTDRTNTNGIIGGYATLGSDWAINSTNLGDGAITALAAYDGALATSGGLATSNFTLTGSQTQVGVTAANTVKITNTGNSETLALGAANHLTITSASAISLGGIMYTGGADGNYAITGVSGGRIQSSVANQELVFAVNSGTLSVGALIFGNSAVTKTGAGTLVISSTNTGNGAHNVNEGVLRLNNAAATGAAGNFGGLTIFVQNGAALELNGFTFTDGERLMISGSGISNGGALRAVAGTNTWRGLIEIDLGGARINNDSASTLTIGNGISTVSGSDVTIGGTGNTTVAARTNIGFGSHAITGGGGLIKDGAGTLTLSARNNYTGNTTVNSGTLDLSDNASLRFNLGFTSGANNSISGAGTVALNGDFFIDTSAADSLSSGSWTLENVSTLSGPYGATFTVVGFTDAGGDQWTKVVGGKTYSFNEATGILNLAPIGPDVTPPTLTSIADNQGGGPITVGTLVTYTVTFNEDMDASTVSSADFSNAGSSTITIGTITETTPGVFTVQVTPTSAGSLILQIPTTASLTDVAGNALDNDPALADDTTITVNVANPYAAWSGGAAFDADANNDGVKNGLAFLLGAAGPNAAVTLPVTTQSSGNLVLNFSMRNAANRGSVALNVEHSSDLGIADAWTAVTVPESSAAAVNGVAFSVSGSGPLNVTATIQSSEAASGKLFGRLKAVQTP